jgi:hypothetical protein
MGSKMDAAFTQEHSKTTRIDYSGGPTQDEGVESAFGFGDTAHIGSGERISGTHKLSLLLGRKENRRDSMVPRILLE